MCLTAVSYIQLNPTLKAQISTRENGTPSPAVGTPTQVVRLTPHSCDAISLKGIMPSTLAKHILFTHLGQREIDYV